MRRLSGGRVLVGALLACTAAGVALAQKPAPLGAPEVQQGGKPPPLGAAPAPRPGRPAPAPAPQAAPAPAPAPQASPTPAPGTDKFGQAQPAPAAPEAPQQADKFAQPQPATPAPAPAPQQAVPQQADKFGQSQPGTPGGQAPAPQQQARPAPTPPPANEPETVARLRGLLGPETSLSYSAADLVDPARGAVRMREVVLQRPDRSAAIAELTLDGLRDNGVTEAEMRGVLLQEGAPGSPGDRVRIDRVRIAGLAVNRPANGQPPMPNDVAVDSLRIEGLRSEGETAVGIASLSVEDYGNGRPGRVALERLEVRQAGQDVVDRIALGRLSLRGVDIAATLAALIAKQAPPRTTGSAALEAEDLVIAKGDQQVGGLASLTLAGEAPAAGATGAEAGRLALRGITVRPFAGAEDWMRQFGYDQLVGDMTMDVRLDRAARRLEVGSFSLGARDMAALGFSITLDGIDPDETDPAALARARLVSMRLRYVDQSLYGRFVRWQAQQSRRSEQQVREELAGQARAIFERPPGARPGPGGKGGGSGSGGAASAEIGNAVQRFLRGQAREIEIAAQPPQPVPFEQLQGVTMGGPDALQQALNLTVTTK